MSRVKSSTDVPPRYAGLYAFTTENIAGYFPKLNFTGKHVLSVCGSGDHLLNAFYYGAETVTVFDINPAAYYLTELKCAALQTLDYAAFLKFFLLEDNSHALDFAVYAQLRAQLSSAAAHCFDNVYDAYQHNGLALRRSEIFNNKFDKNELKLRYNPYLHSTTAYLECRRQTQGKDITSHVLSVEQLGKHSTARRFDLILLSNLADRVDLLAPPTLQPLEYFQSILASLLPRLAPRGQLIAAYVYNVDAPNPARPVDDASLRQHFLSLPDVNYEEHEFAGAVTSHRDRIAVLKLKQAGRHIQ